MFLEINTVVEQKVRGCGGVIDCGLPDAGL